MSANKQSDQQSRGGCNPRPVRSRNAKHQVGPMPTSGEGDKGTAAVKKKIHEQTNDKG